MPMQNRYIADVGDFGKYGLLRKVAGVSAEGPKYTLGIVWYLVPDEDHNGDGRHISYLRKPEYRECDPYLYDYLRKIVLDSSRNVLAIQNSDMFPTGTSYFGELLRSDVLERGSISISTARKKLRNDWLVRAYSSVSDKQIVFLDPDNGIETRSVGQYSKKGIKYVYWDELKQFSCENNILVVYHHLNRTLPSARQIEIKMQEWRENLKNDRDLISVLFRRGSHRVFFISSAEDYQSVIRSRIEEMQAGVWARHIDVIGL